MQADVSESEDGEESELEDSYKGGGSGEFSSIFLDHEACLFGGAGCC